MRKATVKVDNEIRIPTRPSKAGKKTLLKTSAAAVP
jgi:hypothetical protein